MIAYVLCLNFFFFQNDVSTHIWTFLDVVTVHTYLRYDIDMPPTLISST
jgi:hypothetical protein